VLHPAQRIADALSDAKPLNYAHGLSSEPSDEWEERLPAARQNTHRVRKKASFEKSVQPAFLHASQKNYETGAATAAAPKAKSPAFFRLLPTIASPSCPVWRA
jgi:hypothetical protein